MNHSQNDNKAMLYISIILTNEEKLLVHNHKMQSIGGHIHPDGVTPLPNIYRLSTYRVLSVSHSQRNRLPTFLLSREVKRNYNKTL